MKRFIPVITAALLLVLPLAGCGGSDSGDAGSGTEISIADDQTATVGTADTVAVGDNTVLRLRDVEDNRCPTGLACLRYEASFANVALLDADGSAPVATVRIAEDAEETLTSPRTGIAYRVRLEAIAPERPNFDAMPQENYRVTLRVRRVR